MKHSKWNNIKPNMLKLMKTIHCFLIIFFLTVSYSYAITYNDLLEETGHVSNERKTLDDVEKEHQATRSSRDWFTQSKLYFTIGGSYTGKVGYDQDYIADNIHFDMPDPNIMFPSGVITKPSIGANLAVGFSPFDGKYYALFVQNSVILVLSTMKILYNLQRQTTAVIITNLGW